MTYSSITLPKYVPRYESFPIDLKRAKYEARCYFIHRVEEMKQNAIREYEEKKKLNKPFSELKILIQKVKWCNERIPKLKFQPIYIDNIPEGVDIMDLEYADLVEFIKKQVIYSI